MTSGTIRCSLRTLRGFLVMMAECHRILTVIVCNIGRLIFYQFVVRYHSLMFNVYNSVVFGCLF